MASNAWAVSALQATDLPDLGGSYIKNSISQQASSNFNISGSGTAGGTLSGNIVNAATQYNLDSFRVLTADVPQNLFVGITTGAAITTGFDNSFFGLMIWQLRPVTFNWKASGRPDLGFDCRGVVAVEPLLVTHNASGEVEGVKYDSINAVLVNAVKEQRNRSSSNRCRSKRSNMRTSDCKARWRRYAN